MQYMILIYSNEAAWNSIPPDQLPAIFEQWMGYGKAMEEAGVFRAGSQLHPTHTATTLRAVDGKITATDGPFAETKEQLGGYYLIEVPDLDTAVHWAGRCPAVHGGSIELRPLVASNQAETFA